MEKLFEVEVGKIEVGGSWVHSVRVTEDGKLLIKGHFTSQHEARDIAEAEARRLGVEVRYLD